MVLKAPTPVFTLTCFHHHGGNGVGLLCILSVLNENQKGAAAMESLFAYLQLYNVYACGPRGMTLPQKYLFWLFFICLRSLLSVSKFMCTYLIGGIGRDLFTQFVECEVHSVCSQKLSSDYF